LLLPVGRDRRLGGDPDGGDARDDTIGASTGDADHCRFYKGSPSNNRVS
jgi:hypothetical protein